jgi:hypothetical protein
MTGQANPSQLSGDAVEPVATDDPLEGDLLPRAVAFDAGNDTLLVVFQCDEAMRADDLTTLLAKVVGQDRLCYFF